MDPNPDVTIARAKALETLCFEFWILVQRLQTRLKKEKGDRIEPTELW